MMKKSGEYKQYDEGVRCRIVEVVYEEAIFYTGCPITELYSYCRSPFLSELFNSCIVSHKFSFKTILQWTKELHKPIFFYLYLPYFRYSLEKKKINFKVRGGVIIWIMAYFKPEN